MKIKRALALEPCRLHLLHLFSNLRKLFVELGDVGRSGLGLGLGILVPAGRLLEGSQFTNTDFTNVLLNNDIRISIDGKGRWFDDVFVERLWRSVK